MTTYGFQIMFIFKKRYELHSFDWRSVPINARVQQ